MKKAAWVAWRRRRKISANGGAWRWHRRIMMKAATEKRAENDGRSKKQHQRAYSGNEA